MKPEQECKICLPTLSKDLLYWIAIITLIVMLVGTGLQNDKVTRTNRYIVGELNDCLQNNTIVVPTQCPQVNMDIDWDKLTKESG